MANQIYIKNLRLHAKHGVLEQERVVGNDYVLNVVVDYPFLSACESDDLSGTLSYAHLSEIIRQEMSVPSNLLEHVAYRICKAVKTLYPKTERVRVDIRKLAPPMSIDSDGAGVIVEL